MPRSTSARRSNSRIVTLAGTAGLIALLIVLILPAFNQSRSSPRSPCRNNIKQIGLALHNYHDTYGSFPPAVVYGHDGRPWHSWRTLLLPYLEQGDLYARYRFDEPWDGPNNRRIAAETEILPIYRCPSEPDPSSTSTSYLAVVGAGTMWPPGGTTTLDDATDGADRTLHVVEVSDSGVHWMEPVDLRLDAMAFAIGPRNRPGIRSGHGGTDRWFQADDPWVASVEFVDGSVRTLGDDLSEKTVKSLLLRDDGGPADDEIP